MTFPDDDCFGHELHPLGACARVIPKLTLSARTGWADAAKAVALSTDDVLLLGEFANEDENPGAGTLSL